ncbi:FAD/NAD(P)-binding oxidoreductase family protein [Klebsormidium nitens]|uniref:Pyridine nucleotide-disulfide oxidoreductase domain-containing protein 2 n=1 Tax=Klebsormidium nitens TaxID=105231 RepID=A0A1Y1HKC3_KLENI|nr:FAD/NAD(P)-binding oxidoreductase family protein [Klebsormidium nitens]|eukprot:GAQ78062.1 FAD/NAD(P)-binding oxidoreductase family protein [Klebsormidium nitens]
MRVIAALNGQTPLARRLITCAILDFRRAFSSLGPAVVDFAKGGPADLTIKVWDAVVIGGGHNGLTAAAYLAKAGKSVAVLERRHVLGGAAVTEELVPGFKFSRCSYLQSLLRPQIIRDLDLHRHSLKLLPRNPSSFIPSRDGKSYLLMGPDEALNRREVAKFSAKDAEALPKYEAQLERFCALLDPLLDAPPLSFEGPAPSRGFRSLYQKAGTLTAFLGRSAKTGSKDLTALYELMVAPAAKVLDRWFESDVLKAALATDAVIGAMASPYTPGSGYVLLHHVMGETNGHRGIWSFVEGGMGAVSAAIARSAVEAGATVVTNAEVAEIVVSDSKRVEGVRLADGTLVRSANVLANTTPHVTFRRLLAEEHIPPEFRRAVDLIDYSSPVTKINLAVDKLPNFTAFPSSGDAPNAAHFGTIHLGAESMADIHTAYQECVNGHPSSRPVIEMTIPSSLDATIAPLGKHVINLFIQYTPYKPKDYNWDEPGRREAFAQRVFSIIDEYAPGFSESIIGQDILTPPDLERLLNLTGGNIFHGSMGLDSLYLLRPVPGWSNYSTPVAGLYLCGSGAHPGGGVMGAPGRNAALTVVRNG